MANGRISTYIFLFVLFVLPLTIYFLFKGLTKPVFAVFPYAYTVDSSGDTLFHEVDNFSFESLTDPAFTQADLRKRMHVISFFNENDPTYTRLLNGSLRRVYDNVNEADFVRILSIHVTDSVPLSQGYIDSMEVDANAWAFVNATPDEAFPLAQKMGLNEFAYKSPTDGPFTAQMIALVDMEGRVRKYVYGTDLVGIRQLNEDIRALWLLEYKDKE